jgi:hypothetical protein
MPTAYPGFFSSLFSASFPYPFIPLSLCPFVPLSLCPFVPIPLLGATPSPGCAQECQREQGKRRRFWDGEGGELNICNHDVVACEVTRVGFIQLIMSLSSMPLRQLISRPTLSLEQNQRVNQRPTSAESYGVFPWD